MAVQTIGDGQQPRNQQQPREHADHRSEGHPLAHIDDLEPRQRIRRLFLLGRTKLVLDDHDEVVRVQVLEPDSGRVLEELVTNDLLAFDYHGILVDLDT